MPTSFRHARDVIVLQLSNGKAIPAEGPGEDHFSPRSYPRLEHSLTPDRGRNKPESLKAANRAHARLRSPGERANAQLKNWHILRKLRCCPWKAGQLAKAIHVLQARELAR